MFVRALGAALALGLGLAGVAVAPAHAADEPAAVKLAIAVPIIVPASADPLLDADALAQYTSEAGLLTRELDAVIGRPVALGIDPRIIASIRLLGSTAPASATAWLERLEAAPNQTFALAWADADVTLLTQSGSGGVPQPEGVDFAIDPALFAPAPGTATPQPTSDPAGPDLPTSEEVLAWPYSLTGIAWPRDDTVVATDVPLIVGSGYTTTIMSSQNLTREATAGPVSTVDGANILVSDAAVSTALRSATGAVLSSDWTPALAELSVAIAAGSRVQSAAPVLFATLDREILASGNRLAETLDMLAADPAVQLVPFSAALGSAASPAAVVDEPQPADRISRAGQMIEGENAERAFASVASDPAAINSARRLELLTLLSAEWAGNLAGWPTAADAFTTASIELRNAVHIVKSSNFLLIADNDQYLPITVNNGLTQPATVYVTVKSQSALLAIDDELVQLDIEAGAQAKVNVPVHSLSNGVVEVTVSLSSRTGAPIGPAISSEVNVQAGWETPAVVAVAIAVVLVFGFGLVRTVLRRRRAESTEVTGD